MHHLMTALPVCVLLAMQLMITSAETCNSSQCIPYPPPCGFCGEYITFDIGVENTYIEPKFQSYVTIEYEPRQPLINFLQKAAKQNGVFEFSATYYAPFGLFINTINNVTGNPANKTYWSIISLTNNQMIPCGVSSYIPVQNEVILFNFTTWGHTQKHAAFPQCTFDGCY